MQLIPKQNAVRVLFIAIALMLTAYGCSKHSSSSADSGRAPGQSALASKTLKQL